MLGKYKIITIGTTLGKNFMPVRLNSSAKDLNKAIEKQKVQIDDLHHQGCKIAYTAIQIDSEEMFIDSQLALVMNPTIEQCQNPEKFS